MVDPISVNIWLDDMRKAPVGWLHLHNIEEVEKFVGVVQAIEDLRIEEMSFDFNLSQEKSGIDVLKYLADQCVKYNTKKLWPKKILYHSTDTKGIELMKAFAESFEKDVLTGLGK